MSLPTYWSRQTKILITQHTSNFILDSTCEHGVLNIFGQEHLVIHGDGNAIPAHHGLILENVPDPLFYDQYHMDKPTFNILKENIGDIFENESNRNGVISPATCILLSPRLLSCGSSQKVRRLAAGLSQSSTSRILRMFSDAVIERLAPDYGLV